MQVLAAANLGKPAPLCYSLLSEVKIGLTQRYSNMFGHFIAIFRLNIKE